MVPPDDSLIEQRLRRLFSGHEAPTSRPQPDAPPAPVADGATAPSAGQTITPVATAGPPPRLTLADLEGETAGRKAVLHVVRFQLGGQHFAVPLAEVREVQNMPRLTRVPNSEVDVLGLVNLRGSVVPIFDVRRRLSLVPGPPGPRARVLVFEEAEQSMGVMADAVLGASQLPLPLREPPAGSASETIEGVVEVDGVLVTVLRPSALMRQSNVRE